MEALEAIYTRRSTRRFKDAVPPRTLVEQVIEAGRMAPSGSNSQATHLIAITSPTVLDELTHLVESEFKEMEEGPDTYVSLRNSIRASKRGGYVFHYAAPVLIVCCNKASSGNSLPDSACVLENMMIAACALGLGSCWINQLRWLQDRPAIRSALESIGLGTDEMVTGGLALGYAEKDDATRTPPERHGNPVTWVE